MTDTSCREMARCLSAFVDGELDAAQLVALQVHVDSCCECADKVTLARATRAMVRHAVQAAPVPDALRARVSLAVIECAKHSAQTDVMTGTPRLLSWRIVGPTAAAAAFAIVWAATANRSHELAGANNKAESITLSAASTVPVEDFLEDMVDQHVHPLPSEASNPTEMAGFDQYVGVPVRASDGFNVKEFNGKLMGARMVPIHRQRAAMLQYQLTNGRRISVYVYNPHRIRVAASPVLRERFVENAPIYVGYVRGYSVAVTDKRGVGYAVASDLDEQASSSLLLALGGPP